MFSLAAKAGATGNEFMTIHGTLLKFRVLRV